MINIKYYILLSKSKINNTKSFKFILITLLCCVFFSIPVLFSYDSSIYIEYLDFFNGKLPWSIWGKTRGWGYPFFLWLSGLIFGESSYGLSISCFIIFSIFLLYVNKIIQGQVGTKNMLQIFFALLFILNPIILGFYHFMLTEPLAATICAYVMYKVIYYQKIMLAKCISKSLFFKKICLVVFSCIFLYFIKQMFFIIPVLASLFSDISLIIKKKLSFPYLLLSICITFIFLFFSIKLWNTVLSIEPSSSTEVQIEDTIFSDVNVTGQNLFNAYLIKGAINFELDRINQTITVYNQDEIIDIIQYSGEINQIKYIYTCFINHPFLLLKGYFDGYGALTNIFDIEVSPGQAVSSGKIVKDFSLIRGFENYLIGCYFRHLHYGYNTYEHLGRGEKLVQYGQYADDNLVTKTIYSPAVIPFYNFTFTMSLLYAPLAMIWHAIVCWVKRKKETTNFHSSQFVLAGTVFLYGMALSVMCMHIDRYMFPVYAFAMNVLISDIVYGFREIRIRKHYIKKEKNNDENTYYNSYLQ